MTSTSSPENSTTEYAPRRSQHVVTELEGDGELWQEKIIVCEGRTESGEPQLLIRSYYRNQRTGARVWDEPPSGAELVMHATPEMRLKADLQRQELQLTLDMIPSDDPAALVEGQEEGTKEKKGFFHRFRAGAGKKKKKDVEPAKDLNLQRAIARSLAEQTSTGTDDPIVYFDGRNDEDLALAKALSISLGSGEPTEEELFQRALEASRNESRHNNGTGVASLPEPVFEESSTSLVVPVGKSDPNEYASEDFEAKPAARESKSPAKYKFDPYGK